MPSSNAATRAAQQRARRAGKGHPRPAGPAPKNCEWDGHTEPRGVWRHKDTKEVAGRGCFAERQAGAVRQKVQAMIKDKQAAKDKEAVTGKKHATKHDQNTNGKTMAAASAATDGVAQDDARVTKRRRITGKMPQPSCPTPSFVPHAEIDKT